MGIRRQFEEEMVEAEEHVRVPDITVDPIQEVVVSDVERYTSDGSESEGSESALSSSDGEGVEEIPGECPVCRYMREGPCGAEYLVFDKECVKRETEEMPEECSEHFLAMRACFEQHEYYAFILEMFEDALGDKAKADDSTADESTADDSAAAASAADDSTATAADDSTATAADDDSASASSESDDPAADDSTSSASEVD